MLGASLALVLITDTRVVTGQFPQSPHLRMGVPGFGHQDRTLLQYEGFFVMHDDVNKIPVWVSYQLTRDKATAQGPRYSGSFRTETHLPLGKRASDSDYRGNMVPHGLQRGHMAPDADFKWSDSAQRDTYFLTNVVPQNGRHNGGQWSVLETKIREAATRGNGAVWVITGSKIGGQISIQNTNPISIGNNNVAVPTHMFKIVVRRVGNGYRGSAYWSENYDPASFTPNQTVEAWLTTIDEIEEATGINFCNALPPNVQATFEGRRVPIEML